VCLSVRWDVGLVANRPTSILTTFLPSLERSLSCSFLVKKPL
jgi:hypothetical protein